MAAGEDGARVHIDATGCADAPALHGGAAEARRDRAESEGQMVAEVGDKHSMRSMELEAEAEAKVRNTDGSVSFDAMVEASLSDSASANADREARQRLEGELGLLLILGLLHFASSESKAAAS